MFSDGEKNLVNYAEEGSSELDEEDGDVKAER